MSTRPQSDVPAQISKQAEQHNIVFLQHWDASNGECTHAQFISFCDLSRIFYPLHNIILLRSGELLLVFMLGMVRYGGTDFREYETIRLRFVTRAQEAEFTSLLPSTLAASAHALAAGAETCTTTSSSCVHSMCTHAPNGEWVIVGETLTTYNPPAETCDNQLVFFDEKKHPSLLSLGTGEKRTLPLPNGSDLPLSYQSYQELYHFLASPSSPFVVLSPFRADDDYMNHAYHAPRSNEAIESAQRTRGILLFDARSACFLTQHTFQDSTSPPILFSFFTTASFHPTDARVLVCLGPKSGDLVCISLPSFEVTQWKCDEEEAKRAEGFVGARGSDTITRALWTRSGVLVMMHQTGSIHVWA
jgi:hypothetical protein